MPQTENLRRAALVTGGAKGIGRAICRALAENGMNIAVNYAGSAAAAEETAAACRFMMHQRYGRIISVSSVVGLHGNAGQANYAASKAGLIGLTKSAAKEYAARNITANVVAPGFIATDMTAVLSEPARAAAQAAIPAGKIGHAEDVAAAVAFLAGEQAGYITGQVLCVDGGMGM